MVAGPTPAGSPIVIASRGNGADCIAQSYDQRPPESIGPYATFAIELKWSCPSRSVSFSPRRCPQSSRVGSSQRYTLRFLAVIRIFTTLALFTLAVLAVTLCLGLYLGDLHDPALVHNPKFEQIKQLAMIHKMFGLASALCVVLVNSIVVTYFVGTSRWCKEVVE